MKKIIGVVSLLLCIVVLFSGCSFTLTPETIDKIVSNFSDSVTEVPALDDNYNGRKNFYYLSLDSAGKKEYTKIYNGYMNLKDFTVNIDRENLDYMFNCVLYDNPEIFWVDSTYSYSKSPSGFFIEPDYRCTAEEIKSKNTEIQTAVDRITAQAGKSNSDYAKEKYFHDYICRNTVYDLSTYENNGDTAYSVLTDGRAICEGYARAMKLLLDAVGIYSYLAVGETKNSEGKMEGHMWNVVSVDGELYHVDTTWDDCDGDLGEITYLYFNMTDEDIRKDHYKITPYDNNCISEKFNYFCVNGLMFSSFSGFRGMAQMCAANMSDDLMVEMRFSSDDAYKAAKTKADNNETDRTFYDFTLDIAKAYGKRIKSTSYLYNDDFNYLCIVFEKG